MSFARTKLLVTGLTLALAGSSSSAAATPAASGAVTLWRNAVIQMARHLGGLIMLA
jgi:hypothetical protein